MIYAPVGLLRTEAELGRLRWRYLTPQAGGALRFPVELTPGFEAHYWELLEWRFKCEKDRQTQEVRYVLNKVNGELLARPGNTFLIDYKARLEKRLEAVSKVQP